MSDRVAAVTETSSPSLEPITFTWSWRGTPIPLVYEVSGPASAEPILIAPIWRGPLPTMMNGRKPFQQYIRRLIHAPVIGELLYRLNVSRPVVRMMYRRHVFADPAFLTAGLLADRMRVARQRGARFASACFVTGALDPFDDRAAFLAAARRVQVPILMLYGPHTPPKSRAEMESLAAFPGIKTRLLQRGTLGMAEELAGDIAPLIGDFLSARRPHSAGQEPTHRRV